MFRKLEREKSMKPNWQKELKQDLIRVRNGGMITPVLFKVKDLLKEQRKQVCKFEEEMREGRKKQWREEIVEEIEGMWCKVPSPPNRRRLGYNQAIKDILSKLKNIKE